MAKKKSESAESAKPKPAAAKKAPAKKSEAAAAPAKASAKPATTAKSTAAAKPAAAASAKSSKPQAKGKPAGMMGGLIDTNLAASAAANLLLARRKGRHLIEDPVSIDQIKSDLTKDHSAVAGEVLDQHAESTGGRRPDLPFNSTGGGGGSTPHSQTVGHAAERTFVPRRTGG